MPWPKGKPRKGHINKDGTAHATTRKRNVDLGVAVPRSTVGTDTKPKVSRKRRVEPDVSRVRDSAQEEVGTRTKMRLEADPAAADLPEGPTLHGMVGSGAITQPCPECGYAYADGGYCPDCGWSLPVVRDPYGTHSGRRF